MQPVWHPNLTQRARDVLARAYDLAERRGDAELTATDVALGLLAEGQSVAVHVLSARGVPLEALTRELTAALPAPRASRDVPGVRHCAPAHEEFVIRAEREARELDSPYFGAEHLLLALLRDRAGMPAQVLARHHVEFEDVRADVRRILSAPGG